MGNRRCGRRGRCPSARPSIWRCPRCTQGELGPASKRPRGGKTGVLVGYRLPDERAVSSRNADIRRKLKAGKLKADPEVVLRIARLLLRIRRLV